MLWLILVRGVIALGKGLFFWKEILFLETVTLQKEGSLVIQWYIHTFR